MSDISRGYLQDAMDAGMDANWDTVFALRAALDAAEADKRQAVLDERERCLALCHDDWIGEQVSAAIREGVKP